MENRIFSIDSPKAIKADKWGYLNPIHYMAPHTFGSSAERKFNLCSHASPACIENCLGLHSGQASMVPQGEADTNKTQKVRASRIAKAQRFMFQRAAYLLDVVRSIDNLIKRGKKLKKKLCVRMNGCTDVAYEGIRFTIVRDAKGKAVQVLLGGNGSKNIFDHYPKIQFCDYTKNHTRFARCLPRNYCLTLSRSELNETHCLEALARGVNVAVIF